MLFFRQKNKNEILNVTQGPMLKKMILFAVPVILSGVLQQTFNTADSIVVGRYASAEALGGVSATASLINLIVNLFSGLSVGAAVSISQSIGADDTIKAGRYAHTAIATAFLCGIVVGLLGFFLAEPILKLMGTPKENIGYSVKYMRIYFCGAPFILLYNYGSAVMRALGDTKRPLLYLIFGGVVNVLLNLILVMGFGFDADGVAFATVVSNMISASLVLYTLCNSNHCCRINLRNVRLLPKEFKKIVSLGLPAGIQSSMFSISNVVMQSSINSFGAAVVAGNGAAVALESYGSFVSEGFSQTAMTFSGQNTGAKKYDRLKNVFWQTNLCGVIMVVALALIVVPLRHTLIGLFIPDNAVAVHAGSYRLMWTYTLQFFGSTMVVTSSCLRGMGKSFIPMLTTVFGVCVLRILWIMTVFRKYHTVQVLYGIYPLTWALTTVVLSFMFFYCCRKFIKLQQKSNQPSKQQ